MGHGTIKTTRPVDALGHVKAPDSTVDEQKTEIEDISRDLQNKVDKRIEVEHTFTSTSEENFEHKFGRIPKGYIVLNQTAAAVITGDKTKWTSKRIYLTSSVQPNTVSFLIV